MGSPMYPERARGIVSPTQVAQLAAEGLVIGPPAAVVQMPLTCACERDGGAPPDLEPIAKALGDSWTGELGPASLARDVAALRALAEGALDAQGEAEHAKWKTERERDHAQSLVESMRAALANVNHAAGVTLDSLRYAEHAHAELLTDLLDAVDGLEAIRGAVGAPEDTDVSGLVGGVRRLASGGDLRVQVLAAMVRRAARDTEPKVRAALLEELDAMGFGRG